jgi:hypothetical protein
MVKTIRISEKLYEEFLSQVPKGISYSDFLEAKLQDLLKISKLLENQEAIYDSRWKDYMVDYLDRLLKRLEAYDKNPVCWIINKKYNYSSCMSEGYRNGVLPYEEDTFTIVTEKPKSKLLENWRESGINREYEPEGLLEYDDKYRVFCLNGFASVDAAKTYIVEFLLAKPKPNSDNLEYARFDRVLDTYIFIDDYLRSINMKFDFRELSGVERDKEIKKIAQNLVQKAAEQGIGIMPDYKKWPHIIQYCIKQYDENPHFFFTMEQYEVDIE